MKAVHDQDFEERVIGAESPVLVEFYESWCSPCKPMLAEVLPEVEERLRGVVNVVRCDFDANPQWGDKLAVRVTPARFLFVDGKMVWRGLNYMDAEVITLKILAALSDKDPGPHCWIPRSEQ